MILYGFVLILFIALLAVLLSGVEISDAFSGTLASLGNVGPGLGSLGTMGNYASQPVFAKIVYTAVMFLGRLEILPVLAVMHLVFNFRKNASGR